MSEDWRKLMNIEEIEYEQNELQQIPINKIRQSLSTASGFRAGKNC